MAKNTSDLVRRLGFKNIQEVDWNETIRMNDLTIEAFPVKHFGWRYTWEKDRSRGNRNGRSFNAYLLQDGIYLRRQTFFTHARMKINLITGGKIRIDQPRINVQQGRKFVRHLIISSEML